MNNAQLAFLLLFLVSCCSDGTKIREEELDAAFWNRVGKETLEKNLHSSRIEKPAKNVVFFLGDGMGMPTVTAARIYEGQLKGMAGEENALAFESFPNVGLAKTYNVDRTVPDSAGTTTAFLCGVKSNMYTIGVTARVKVNDCKASLKKENQLLSIMRWAQQAGRATGFITTTRVTHATPAGLYANTCNRQWESDSKVPDKHRGKCLDIAAQLIHSATGQNAKVILGGGWKNFFTEKTRPGGKRLEGNLVEQWLEQKKNKKFNKLFGGRGDGNFNTTARAKVVYNLKEFNEVDVDNVDFLLGLFHPDHMTFENDWTIAQEDQTRDEPSISQMVEKAIKILSKLSPDKGFFLFVEGGQIDFPHHSNEAKWALVETVAFSDAIRLAQSMTDPEETLTVVTADHSHVMTINGYPERGHDILGTVLADSSDPQSMYTTLMYTNGPGYRYPPPKGTGIDISGEDTTSDKYVQLAAYPRLSETHGGEDVPVYSQGPMSHILRGVFEQNYLPHAIAYAACYRGDLCKSPRSITSDSATPASTASSASPPTHHRPAYSSLSSVFASVVVSLLALKVLSQLFNRDD